MSQPPGPQGPYQQFPPGQGGYPAPGYPQYGGYGPYGGPPKKKSKLPWILGGIGVLLVAGGVVAALLLFNGKVDFSTPKGTAEAFRDAFNDRDVEGIKELMCKEDLEAIAMTGQDRAAAILAGVRETQQAGIAVIRSNGSKSVASLTIRDEYVDDEHLEVPIHDTGGVTHQVCFSRGLLPPGEGKKDYSAD